MDFKSNIISQYLNDFLDKSFKKVRILDDSSLKRFEGNRSNSFFNAIVNKQIVYDPNTKKVLADIDGEPYELEKSTREKMLRSMCKVYDDEIDNLRDNVSVSNIANLLIILECISSAYLDVDSVESKNRIRGVQKKLNTTLCEIKRKNPETKAIINNAIEVFVYQTADDMPQEEIKFPELPYVINHVEDKKRFRLEFISNLIQDNVIDYSFLLSNQIIIKCDFDTLDNIFRKKGLLTNKDLENILINNGVFKTRGEIVKYYFHNDRKFFLSFAVPEEIVDYFLDGVLDLKEISKALNIKNVTELSPKLLEQLLSVKGLHKNMDFITTKSGDVRKYIDEALFKHLNREQFMQIVSSDKIEYVIPLKSEDYVNYYGKINSDDLIALNEKGLVDSEDMIKMIKFAESTRISNEEEYNRMIENLKRFYNLDRLKELIDSNRINAKFSELFNIFINENLSEEQRTEYFQSLVNEIENRDDCKEIIPLLIKKGIDVPSNINYQLNQEEVFDMYLQEVIDENDIVRFYQKGFVEIGILKEILSKDQMKEKFQNGEIDCKILLYIADRQKFIQSEVKKGKISLEDLIDMYSLKDGLDIEELEEISKDHDMSEINIAELLPDSIESKKIEDLFMHYYISHDDLTYLSERGLITEREAEEFAKKLTTNEIYEEIFNYGRVVTLKRENEKFGNDDIRSLGYREGNSRQRKIKNDPILQENLIYELGFDDRVLYLEGDNNSLSGYKVYSSKDLGVMLFLNGDKPGNATYIMSLQQGLYWLNKSKKGNGKLESDATKASLRETTHVKVKNASGGWGRNVVNAIKVLNPDFKKKYKDTYKQKVDEIIDEIKEDYDLRKE